VAAVVKITYEFVHNFILHLHLLVITHIIIIFVNFIFVTTIFIYLLLTIIVSTISILSTRPVASRHEVRFGDQFSTNSSSFQDQTTEPNWTMATASMAGASTNRVVVADNDGVNSSDGINELLTPVSTLDEPVGETIMRDVRAVGAKLRAVLMPLDRSVR
jgi:hypothetical protein